LQNSKKNQHAYNFHTLLLKFIHNSCMKTSKHKRILGGER
jgi:hypothetical protein